MGNSRYKVDVSIEDVLDFLSLDDFDFELGQRHVVTFTIVEPTPSYPSVGAILRELYKRRIAKIQPITILSGKAVVLPPYYERSPREIKFTTSRKTVEALERMVDDRNATRFERNYR